jgi:hypothetical protein
MKPILDLIRMEFGLVVGMDLRIGNWGDELLNF